MLGSIWWVDLIFGRHVGVRVERVVTPVSYQHSLGQENAEEHSRHTTHYHNAPKTGLKRKKKGGNYYVGNFYLGFSIVPSTDGPRQ